MMARKCCIYLSAFFISLDFCETINQPFLGPASWDTGASFSSCYGNSGFVRLFPFKKKKSQPVIQQKLWASIAVYIADMSSKTGNWL